MRKKFFLSFLMLFTCVLVNAQILRTEELEKYAKEKYGDNWTEAAQTIAKDIQLDKNNAMTFVQVIPCEGQTKEQLYINLNYWFTASFNDANSVIKLNDKESGCIIASGYMANMAGHAGGTNSYSVSIKPIIRLDIKDNKIRVTYSIDHYDVTVSVGGGILGSMGGRTATSKKEEKWVLDKTFPFAQKDGYHAKKTSSKALVMAYAYSNALLDKIEEAAKRGLVGNENNDW